MGNDVVIGLDGGGTRTRVAIADLGGHVLGVAEREGASIEFNDSDAARRNLREGVRAALADAGRSPGNVVEFTAGIAGLDRPRAVAEAERALDIDGLGCDTRMVDDAVVAHIGAFCGDSGVVAICGTGSVIFGMTTDGEQISNFDCVHHARAGAHNLGERALHAVLAGAVPDDWALENQLLDWWGCDSVSTLRAAVRDQDRFTNVSSENPFDSVAPLITNGAADGDAVAQEICDDAVGEVVTGIRIVGGYLDNPVAVAPAGSVLRSNYMTAELRRQVAATDGNQYVVPAMSPVAGAVYDAVDRATGANEAVVDRLTDHPIGRA